MQAGPNEENENRMIINHNHVIYRRIRASQAINRYNGAYYYSKEICERIIPNVKTDYNWITVNVQGVGCDHSIVFIHNNMFPDRYEWLSKYNDLILVCGIPETMDKVKHLGRPIYLPLSVNVAEIEQYKKPKTKDTAFAGRPSKKMGFAFPEGTDILQGLPREVLLDEMAAYNNVYAVGRTAIEAKVLGCNILPYDTRFPDVGRWKVIDNLEAADMLQEELNK